MNFIFTLSLLALFSFDTTKNVVVEYHSLKGQKQEKAFINSYKNVKDPSIRAYVIAIQMKQAEYAINPLTKYKIFNNYNNQLNSLIKTNPKNIHLRYVRLMIQENLPSFLVEENYLTLDKAFLKTYMEKGMNESYLAGYIKKNTSL